MHFCIQCDNMYYIGISETDSNKLNYYCRHCGHVNENLVTDGMCVLDTQTFSIANDLSSFPQLRQ